MLVAEKDNLTNMWLVVRREGGGLVPEELKGWFTSQALCQRHIDRWVLTNALVTDVKEARANERELWKKAKAMKGIPSRDAFEMLKAQQEAGEAP
jgi:hypothetical protein